MKNDIALSLLVVISHSGMHIPSEIELTRLSDNFNEIVQTKTDLYTDILYNFTNILGNQQCIFDYSPVILDANRHPQNIDQSSPLSYNGLRVYKPGIEPDLQFRRNLVKKYILPYHQKIARTKKSIILDAHSTVDGHFDVDGTPIKEDIILDDFQQSEYEPSNGIRTAPKGFLETYANELVKLLPKNIVVDINLRYTHIYGYTMAKYSWDGIGIQGNRVPVFLQETNERLYITDGQPNVEKMAGLNVYLLKQLLIP